jgi:hypothetical protein
LSLTALWAQNIARDFLEPTKAGFPGTDGAATFFHPVSALSTEIVAGPAGRRAPRKALGEANKARQLNHTDVCDEDFAG